MFPNLIINLAKVKEMFKVGAVIKRKKSEMKSGQWYDVENNDGIFIVTKTNHPEMRDKIQLDKDWRWWNADRFELASNNIEEYV